MLTRIKFICSNLGATPRERGMTFAGSLDVIFLSSCIVNFYIRIQCDGFPLGISIHLCYYALFLLSFSPTALFCASPSMSSNL